MANLRQRVPFKSESEDPGVVLDEQEQEQVIQGLRDDVAGSSRTYLIGAQAILALSVLLHIIYLTDPSRPNPVSRIFHPRLADTPIPSTVPFSLLSILVFVSLGLPMHFSHVRLPQVTTMLGLSAVAPTLSLLMGKTWQTVLWWSITPAVGMLMMLLKCWIEQGEEDIRNLEKMKYDARGP